MLKDLIELNELLNKSGASKERPYYVGLVVIDRAREKIMLGKRREDGCYTGPGGAAEGQEHPKQAAIREAFEEAGLQLTSRDLQELPSQATHDGKVCHSFLAYVDSKTTKVHSANDPDREVAQWEWFSLHEELPKKIGELRLNTINNAKLRFFGLRKSEDLQTLHAALHRHL